MIKAVIFDYGGVIKVAHRLSDDIPEIFNISKEEMEKQSKNVAPLFSLLQRNLITEDDFWKKYAEIINKPLPENCGKMARDLYQKYFVLYPEVLEFVKDLKHRKIKSAVLSNIIELQANVIRKNGGYDGFDVVVLSYQEKLQKPEPEIYLLTAKKLNVQPNECIFIDDKEENIETAKNLGMRIVFAKNPKQVIKDINDIIQE